MRCFAARVSLTVLRCTNHTGCLTYVGALGTDCSDCGTCDRLPRLLPSPTIAAFRFPRSAVCGTCNTVSCSSVAPPDGGTSGSCPDGGRLADGADCVATCSDGTSVMPMTCQYGSLRTPTTCCTAGTYWNPSGSQCTACPIGRADIDADPTSACDVCPSGQYSAEEGATECAICEPGRHSSPESTECTLSSWHTADGVSISDLSTGESRVQLDSYDHPLELSGGAST